MNKKFHVVSLFAGVGGVCQGFKNANMNVIWANEIDKMACVTYMQNHEDTVIINKDINDVLTQDIPDSDILTAGFPCQSFSIAGYRKGFEDERGNLFFSILRILREKDNKPRVIFLENVKNLMTHDKGNTFKVICNELEKLGYLLHVKILNSCDYGNVPQNRERIFIIGFLDKQAYECFEFPRKIKLDKNINDIKEKNVNNKYYYTESSKYYEELIKNMTNKSSIYQIRRVYIRENKSNLCPTLTANMGTGGHNVPLLMDDKGIRKLTPKECFNLQGFPHSFKLPEISDCHLYKQVGNAVTVTLIERIAKNIIKALCIRSNAKETISNKTLVVQNSLF